MCYPWLYFSSFYQFENLVHFQRNFLLSARLSMKVINSMTYLRNKNSLFTASPYSLGSNATLKSRGLVCWKVGRMLEQRLSPVIN